MRPGTYDLTVQRGASLCHDFPVFNDDGTAWDLTGFQAKLRFFDADRTVVMALDAVQGSAAASLTVHASKTLTIDGETVTAGTIELDLSPTETDDLAGFDDDAREARKGPLRYQLDIVDSGGKTHRLLVGEIESHMGVPA